MFGGQVRLGIIRKPAACKFECRRTQQILAVSLHSIVSASSSHISDNDSRRCRLEKENAAVLPPRSMYVQVNSLSSLIQSYKGAHLSERIGKL